MEDFREPIRDLCLRYAALWEPAFRVFAEEWLEGAEPDSDRDKRLVRRFHELRVECESRVRKAEAVEATVVGTPEALARRSCILLLGILSAPEDEQAANAHEVRDLLTELDLRLGQEQLRRFRATKAQPRLYRGPA